MQETPLRFTSFHAGEPAHSTSKLFSSAAFREAKPLVEQMSAKAALH